MLLWITGIPFYPQMRHHFGRPHRGGIAFFAACRDNFMFSRDFAPVKRVNNVYNQAAGDPDRSIMMFAPVFHGELLSLGMAWGGTVGQIVA